MSPVTPARLTLASLLALSLFAGTIGAVGQAQATSTGNAPSVLELPPVHIGDRGLYTITTVRGGAIVEPERPLVAFEQDADTVVRGFDGQLHAVHAMTVVDHDGTVVNDEPVLTTFFHDAMDGRVVATQYAYNATPSLGAPGQPAPAILPATFHSSGIGTNLQFIDGSDPQAEPPLLCGLRNHLQGTPTSLDHDLSLFPACSYVDFWGERQMFRARGLETLDGRPAVFFHNGGSGSSDIFAWFAGDVPYPLRISVEDQDEPDLYHVVRLAAFEPGNGAGLRPFDPPASDPAPALDWASRPAWGLDEAGIDHPFPLSVAYRHALDDERSGLTQWLASHPSAYMHSAGYSERTGPRSTERLWAMGFTDGEARADVLLQQNVRTTGPALPLPDSPLDDLSSQETTYEYREGSAGGADVLPRPHQVPAKTPTVASLWARWAMHASAEMTAEEPNSWGFHLGCRAEDCADVFWSFQAGVQRFNESDADVTQFVTQSYSADIRSSILSEWLSGQGVADQRFLGEVTLGAARTPDAFTLPSRPSTPPETAPTNLAVDAWGFPDGVWIASAATLALLAALAVLLWPAKVGALGLFSRIEGPALLEHPLRKAIHQAVEASPGIHVKDLVRTISKPRGTVDHHVHKLVDAGLLSVTSSNGYSCLFVKAHGDRRLHEASPFVRAPGARRLLEEVVAGPGRSLRELAAAAGIAPSVASYHVGRLEKAGLLLVDRDGAALRLSVTELGLQAAA